VRRISRWGRELPVLGSLRTRLSLLVLAGVVPILVLVLYASLEERNQAVEVIRQDALQMVRVASDRQDQLLESAQQLLSALALLHEVQNHDKAACERIFANLLALYPVYANLGAIRPGGEVFASAVPLTEAVNLSEHSHFRLPVETRQFAIGECEIGRINRKATLHVGYPAIDAAGQLRAVVYAALDLTWLRTMLTNSTLPKGSSLTVTDPNRVTLVRYPDPEGTYVGQLVPRSGARTNARPGRFDTNAPPTPSERMRWRRGTGSRTNEISGIGRGRDGVERLYATTQLGHTGETNAVRVTVGIPVAVAYAPANHALLRSLLVVGLVTAGALGLAWFGGNIFILRRVKALMRANDQLSAGDYNARVGGPYGPGELHLLSKTFDDMAATLQKRIEEREKTQAKLRALNEELEQRVASRTAQLERSNRDLEQFAYVASHDLQEPLRMVSNYVALLRDRYQDQLDAKAREFLGFALDGATRMQELILALLDYSRVDTQGQPFETTDCNQVLERVLLNLKVASDESHAAVTLNPLPTVLADGVQLGQVFQNLIANAIKFRGENPPEVQVAATPEDGGWHFTVRDNGIGIAEEHFRRIFVLFQRLHSRTRYPGTGIGLALCKKITERHGGRIWVESKPGQGATFHFTLAPAEPSKNPDSRS
jgi:signal transduction histidine kinase